MSRVSKKEDEFFEMLQKLSQDVVSGAEIFKNIASMWPQSCDCIDDLKRFEMACDTDTRSILQELNVSFITPFDREDVSALAREMDNVIDGMEGTSARFVLFDVGNVIPEAITLSNLIVEAVHELNAAFEKLPHFKKDSSIKDHMFRVVELEDEGDSVYRSALGRVFAEESSDPIHVIKWKSLLDGLENTLDSCKEVSNIFSNVLMKNA